MLPRTTNAPCDFVLFVRGQSAMSTDHKPGVFTEMARVLRCGGQVSVECIAITVISLCVLLHACWLLYLPSHPPEGFRWLMLGRFRCFHIFLKTVQSLSRSGTCSILFCHYYNSSSWGMFVCFIDIYSGRQVRWMYQPGSHRRKVTQDLSCTFLLRCVPLFFSREGFNRSFPSSTVKSNFVY